MRFAALIGLAACGTDEPAEQAFVPQSCAVFPAELSDCIGNGVVACSIQLDGSNFVRARPTGQPAQGPFFLIGDRFDLLQEPNSDSDRIEFGSRCNWSGDDRLGLAIAIGDRLEEGDSIDELFTRDCKWFRCEEQ